MTTIEHGRFKILDVVKDEVLIRSILEDETVIVGISDNKKINVLSRGVYFYDEGVGIYPAVFRGINVSIHAAIPKKNRGIKAVKSARKLAKCIIDSGYDLRSRVRYNDRHVKLFVRLVGFVFERDTGKHLIYRYM